MKNPTGIKNLYMMCHKSSFWNEEDVSATSLAEAAVKEGSLLSFDLEPFNDKKLTILSGDTNYIVDSVNTPKYLVQNYNTYLNVNRKKITSNNF